MMIPTKPTREELEFVAEKMNSVRHDNITPEMIRKTTNSFGRDAYVAALGNTTYVVYTPSWGTVQRFVGCEPW